MSAKKLVIILIMLFGLTGIPMTRAAEVEDTPEVPAEVDSLLAESEQDLEGAAEDLDLAENDLLDVPEAVEAEEDAAVELALPAEAAAEIPALEKAAESAVPAEAAEEAKGDSLFAQYPPQIKMSAWGPEIRINVIPDPEMGAENVLAVQSVKLETEKGEYLGLKTFQVEEKTREAEFMINPEILKVDAVRITVSSQKDGQWTHVHSLKDENGESPEAGKPDAAPTEPAAPAAKLKKKGWWG